MCGTMIERGRVARVSLGEGVSGIDEATILASLGPVQAVLDADDGVVNVVSIEDGVVTLSLEGGCVGCSSVPMTAMQIFYSLMKLDGVKNVIFANGELPPYMQAFILDKLDLESQV